MIGKDLEEVANPNLPQPLPGEDPNAGMPGAGPPTAAYTKDEVAYRPAEDESRSCAACIHFVAKAEQSLGQGMCELVAGQVSPNATCDMFDDGSDAGGGLASLLNELS